MSKYTGSKLRTPSYKLELEMDTKKSGRQKETYKIFQKWLPVSKTQAIPFKPNIARET